MFWMQIKRKCALISSLERDHSNWFDSVPSKAWGPEILKETCWAKDVSSLRQKVESAHRPFKNQRLLQFQTHGRVTIRLIKCNGLHWGLSLSAIRDQSELLWTKNVLLCVNEKLIMLHPRTKVKDKEGLNQCALSGHIVTFVPPYQTSRPQLNFEVQMDRKISIGPRENGRAPFLLFANIHASNFA